MSTVVTAGVDLGVLFEQINLGESFVVITLIYFSHEAPDPMAWWTFTEQSTETQNEPTFVLELNLSNKTNKKQTMTHRFDKTKQMQENH